MLPCTEISFVISFFSFEKFWVKPGLPFTKLNRANTQNLEKINFDMFYKNACWAVICYPICVTNVSYERKIIVLPFPVISFVILIFVSQIFEIKSGFPFYWLTLYRGEKKVGKMAPLCRNGAFRPSHLVPLWTAEPGKLSLWTILFVPGGTSVMNNTQRGIFIKEGAHSCLNGAVAPYIMCP